MAVEGAIKSLCNRLVVVDLSSRTSKDLGEQCVKVSSPLKRYSLFKLWPLLFNYCIFWCISQHLEHQEVYCSTDTICFSAMNSDTTKLLGF